MFCCLKGCLNGVLTTPNVPMRRDSPIQLDTLHMGHEVVIIKGGQRACGSGGVLASSPLVQSKSYFEVKLQQGGIWSIGIGTHQTDLNNIKGGQDKESWCLTSDNIVYNDSKELYKLVEQKQPTAEPNNFQQITGSLNLCSNTGIPQEGDTIGVAYDHVELNFYLNGKHLEVPVLNVKGTVYPCLFVDDGAILDIILDNFNYSPPPGFDRIMIEQSLL